ncbi:MAG: aldo/keto reductase [Terriglobia bacterium]|jgi:predicted aldo/keto reductase-like oxidoreductase
MNKYLPRRDFLRQSAAIVGGAAFAGTVTESFLPPAWAAGQAAAPEGEWRNKQPEMRYRRLGRTGFMVSEIVCGGDPISPTNNRHVELAIDMGLNYLDTAPAYGDGQSEMGYAGVIQGAKRDRVFINTKVSPFADSRYEAFRKIFEGLGASEQAATLRAVSEDIERRRVTVPNYFGNYFNGQIRQVEEAAFSNVMEKKYGAKIDRRETYVATILRSIEGSLQRLKTDHVDLMMCPHGAASAAETNIPEIFEAFEKLRKDGKVRFLGVSAHNDPAGVLRGAMESGVYSMAMVACNIMNWEYVKPAIEEAHRRDFGVIAMKNAQAVFEPDRSTAPVPERAALLNQTVPGDLNIHQKAYRFALNNPHLSAVVSNMVNEQQVRENLAVARA